MLKSASSVTPDDIDPGTGGPYGKTHGSAVGSCAVFLEYDGIDEATHDGVAVTRTGENSGYGMLCGGHVEEGRESDFVVEFIGGRWRVEGRYAHGGVRAEGIDEDAYGGLLAVFDV